MADEPEVVEQDDPNDQILQAAKALAAHEEAEAEKEKPEQETPKAEEPADAPEKPVEEKKEPEGTEPAESTETPKEETPEEVKEETKEEEPEEKVIESKPKPESRRARREARRQTFFESIREEKAKPLQPTQRQEVQPLDYRTLENLEEPIDPNVLQQDRERYAQAKFAEGAELERYTAEQEKFWDRLELQSEKLLTDPKYSFLDEGSDNFDENMAGHFNEMYLAAVGFEQKPQFTPQGAPVVDASGQQVLSTTVKRTDLSYEKFVKQQMSLMDSYAERAKEEAVKKLSAQRSTASIRPNGQTRQAKKVFTSAEITSMSQAEFEENKEAIEAQEREMMAAIDI